MVAVVGSGFANAILETVGVPLLALGDDLRVEVANDAFLRHFEVTRADTIGRLVYDLGNGQWNIPELRRMLGEILPRNTTIEDYRVEHTFETIGRRSMRLNVKRIDRVGASASILIAFTDVTEQERLQAERDRLQHELEGRIEFADKLIDSIREGLLVLHGDLRVHSANKSFYDLFQVESGSTVGRLVYELGNGQWDIPELRRLLEEILPSEKSFDDYEVRHTFERLGPRIMLLNGRRLDHLDLIVLAIRDMTGLSEADQARLERERQQAFLLELADTLRPLSDPAAVEGEACRLIAEHLDVDRAYYVEIDEAAGSARVQRDFVRGDAPSLSGTHEVADFAWSVAILRTGACHVVADVRTSDLVPAADRPACIALGIVACMGAPLIKGGRLVGALCVTDRRERIWTSGDAETLRAVGERIWDAVERVRAEAAVVASEQLMRQAMAAANAGSWKVNVVTGAFTASDRALELHGLPPGTLMDHARALACVHPDDQPLIEAALTRAVEDGEPFRVELRASLPDGTTRWLASYAERHEQVGQAVLVGLVHDITERKLHEQQVQNLMREVNHRSKNILGLVQAIAHQTAATTPADFLERFHLRVQALASAQDLLVRSDWKAVELDALVRSQLEHFSDLIGRRILIAGPSVRLTAPAVQAIGMALHELATNAAKYGALSTETGRVEVTWTLEPHESGPATFDMQWRETCGPPVLPPAKSGFGSSVLHAMIEMTIDGATVEHVYPPAGVTWRMTCVARSILEGGEPAAVDTRGHAKLQPGVGRRILLVEDEPLLASHLSGILSEAGFQVIGPAGTVARALTLIDDPGCDAAILDVNLRNETSVPVADRLQDAGTPFVAVTGYTQSQLPEAFRFAPLLTKPLRHADLIVQLEHMLGTACCHPPS